jgi:hypothetical protein
MARRMSYQAGSVFFEKRTRTWNRAGAMELAFDIPKCLAPKLSFQRKRQPRRRRRTSPTCHQPATIRSTRHEGARDLRTIP